MKAFLMLPQLLIGFLAAFIGVFLLFIMLPFSLVINFLISAFRHLSDWGMAQMKALVMEAQIK